MKDKEKKETSTEKMTAKEKAKHLVEKIRNIFKRKPEEVEEEEVYEEGKWVRIRLLPIWLRIILVLVLLIITVIIGTLIGYSVIGDGSPSDLFKVETWTHITDIIQGVE